MDNIKNWTGYNQIQYLISVQWLQKHWILFIWSITTFFIDFHREKPSKIRKSALKWPILKNWTGYDQIQYWISIQRPQKHWISFIWSIITFFIDFHRQRPSKIRKCALKWTIFKNWTSHDQIQYWISVQWPQKH